VEWPHYEDWPICVECPRYVERPNLLLIVIVSGLVRFTFVNVYGTVRVFDWLNADIERSYNVFTGRSTVIFGKFAWLYILIALGLSKSF